MGSGVALLRVALTLLIYEDDQPGTGDRH